MALQMSYTTRSGIDIQNAVIALTYVQQNQNSQSTYRVQEQWNGGAQALNKTTDSNAQNTAACQARVWFDVDAINANKASVEPLMTTDGMETFTIALDANGGTALEQAYAHLKTLYPDAVEVAVDIEQ